MSPCSSTMLPLVSICGTTGVGKSKLAVELALSLARAAKPAHPWRGARIINADSMQVYTGMDVITNKMPRDERQGVEHLLMDFKPPGEQYVVGEWVNDAIQAIKETHSRGLIPIVVGGTAYWMQHLLFPDRLTAAAPSTTKAFPAPSTKLADALDELPHDLRVLYDAVPDDPALAADDPATGLRLHRLLSVLDPDIAARWHWKDSRKVLRSLVIIKENGRRNSEIIAEQSITSVRPRYRTLCYWLYAERSVLNPRLDARVDDMVQQGLMQEVEELYELTQNQLGHIDCQVASPSVDYTLGIYQSIGFREFGPYLGSDKTSPAAKGFFDQGVELMKVATRQYAKRQVSWLKNKLVPAVHAANMAERNSSGSDIISTYLLDATGKTIVTQRSFTSADDHAELGASWVDNVQMPAESMLQDFLSDKPLPEPVSLSNRAALLLEDTGKSVNPGDVLRIRRKLVCPSCSVNPERPVMIDEGDPWDVHRRTKAHRKLAAKHTRMMVSSQQQQEEQQPVEGGALF